MAGMVRGLEIGGILSELLTDALKPTQEHVGVAGAVGSKAGVEAGIEAGGEAGGRAGWRGCVIVFMWL